MYYSIYTCVFVLFMFVLFAVWPQHPTWLKPPISWSTAHAKPAIDAGALPKPWLED